MINLKNIDKVPMLWLWMLVMIVALYLTARDGIFGIGLEMFCIFQFWLWYKIYEVKYRNV